MIDLFYFYTMNISGAILLFMGCYLFFGKVPGEKYLRIFIKSKKIIGIAMILWSLEYIILSGIVNFPEYQYLICTMNLTTYYAGGLLIGAGVIPLLNNNYINRRQTITDIIKYILFNIYIWSGMIYTSGTVRILILISASLLFAIDVIRMSAIYIKSYKNATNTKEENLTEEIYNFNKWIHKGVYFVIITGFLGSVLAFAPKWILTIYGLSGFIVFIYLFCCLQNYIVRYERKEVRKIPKIDKKNIYEYKDEIGDDENKENINNKTSNEKYKHIEIMLSQWVVKEKYKQSGITIQQLANEFKTNRTYLSDYINSQYNFTFREWINELRIESSKNFLKKNPEMTINEIAEKSGYLSSSHYIRSFISKENISPSKWREININI